MCITKSSSKYYTLWQHQATKWLHTARIFNVSLPLFAFAGADVISFDGYGVIPYRFRSKKLKMLKDAITLKFRTTSRDGVLLHGEGQQGDYISLELRRARLQLSINLGRQSPCQYQLSFTTECWDSSYLLIDDCSVAQRGSIFNINNIWGCSDTKMTEAALTQKEFVVRRFYTKSMGRRKLTLHRIECLDLSRNNVEPLKNWSTLSRDRSWCLMLTLKY